MIDLWKRFLKFNDALQKNFLHATIIHSFLLRYHPSNVKIFKDIRHHLVHIHILAHVLLGNQFEAITENIG